ncbi:MAG: exodeoxyribonuclease VII large subunit [Oscillospiraceae bacterium]|nr:exodeoxyribonuclease VII large subunit [Oscillospiraceae bacterium]
MPEQKIYGVTEANELIKNLIDSVPELAHIYVRGELSNYKIYPSGHHYFTLKDSEGAMRCVMFRGSASKLRFRPENGMRVVAYGRITVFPRDGQYQLYCGSLSPEGAGDLYVAFEQLKAKLESEGLFNREHKKPLPPYPQKIAIVTSSAGAAVHDMIRILKHRFPICKVILLPVRVQGAEAPAEIAGAIRYADKWKTGDLIITGRGGGSMEDLWAFNDERVARAIYDCSLPVISAVGHEPDVTISDYVADVRASTPSNAAEIAVPDMQELMSWLSSAEGRMAAAERQKTKRLRESLVRLRSSRALTDPEAFIQDKRMLLDFMQKRISASENAIFAGKRQTFGALAASLDALSPLKVLGRGYAVAKTADGKIIKSGTDVGVGDKIDVDLGSGSLGCTVDDIR